ncbi:MAG TPA: EAL domain-containing protein [Spirochaetia bacterium]|jgi:EAL domain-containing protein (putative c-di-GMP-specific phosphodiesterase class I)|nr:EAL domain-containing protein [Spirochaetia bacterium]
MDRFWSATVDRLTFAFQPIVSCRTGGIVAVEALLRGVREAGFARIFDVFDLAATDGHLVEVETALRDKALGLFSLLPLDEEVKLFSNIDNRVFSHPSWQPSLVETVLARRGLSPDRLVLEVSERHGFPAGSALGSLTTALDDFGTGFAGLKTLWDLRPRYMKIDRSFIAGIDTDPELQGFFLGMVDLGHRAGALTVAEGVETAGELEFCLSSGCEAVQGFAVGRPGFNGERFLPLVPGRQGLLFSTTP